MLRVVRLRLGRAPRDPPLGQVSAQVESPGYGVARCRDDPLGLRGPSWRRTNRSAFQTSARDQRRLAAETRSSNDPAFVLCVQRANEFAAVPVGLQESGQSPSRHRESQPRSSSSRCNVMSFMRQCPPRLQPATVVGEMVEKFDQLLAFDGHRWANVRSRQVGELHQAIVLQYVTKVDGIGLEQAASATEDVGSGGTSLGICARSSGAAAIPRPVRHSGHMSRSDMSAEEALHLRVIGDHQSGRLHYGRPGWGTSSTALESA